MLALDLDERRPRFGNVFQDDSTEAKIGKVHPTWSFR